MKNFVKYYFYFLFLAPLIAFFLEEQNTNYYTILGISTIFISLLVILQRMMCRSKIYFPIYCILLLLLGIYYSIWGIYNGQYEKHGLFYILFKNEVFYTVAVLIIIKNTEITYGFIRQATKYIILTSIAAALVSLVQFLYNESFFISSEAQEWMKKLMIYERRRFSIFSFLEINEVGFSFIPLYSVGLGYQLNKDNRSWVVVVILGGMVAILSNARYIIIGYLIVTSQVFIYRSIMSNLIRMFALYGSILFIFLYLLLLGNYKVQDFIFYRIISESSTLSRITSLDVFLQFFPLTPILGTGIDVTSAMLVALGGIPIIHIGYLAHIVSYGIIGSILLFVSWYYIFKESFIISNQTKYYATTFALIFFFFSNLTLVKYSLFSYGMIIAFIFNQVLSQKHVSINNNSILKSRSLY